MGNWSTLACEPTIDDNGYDGTPRKMKKKNIKSVWIKKIINYHTSFIG